MDLYLDSKSPIIVFKKLKAFIQILTTFYYWYPTTKNTFISKIAELFNKEKSHFLGKKSDISTIVQLALQPAKAHFTNITQLETPKKLVKRQWRC